MAGRSTSRLEVVRQRSLVEWADVIRADLASALLGIIAAGRHLQEARTQFPPGTFVAWLDSGEAPVGRSQAYALMAIASNEAISGNAGNLPSDVTSLYALTQLAPDELVQAIEDGDVRADTSRSAIKAFVAQRTGRSGNQPPPIPVGEVWRSVVIDCPWPYENVATRGAAVHHYRTMEYEELAALELPLAEQAHLYIWATAAHLPMALQLLSEEWGPRWDLAYSNTLVWAKVNPETGRPQLGMGNQWRNSAEFVVVATRGDIKTRRKDQPTVFFAPRTRHSEKPDVFYEIVESCSWPPYIDLFARRERPGWDVWGDQL